MAGDGITGVAALPGGLSWASLRRGKSGVAAEGVVPREAMDGALPFQGPVVLAIPSSRMVMRVMAFPAVEAAELAGMVDLQVDKFSPFPLEQMVVSHEVLSRDEDGLRVLMVAARIKVVESAGQALRERGVKIRRVDAALLGRWQTLQESRQLESTGRETLVLLDGTGVDVLTHEAGVPIALSGLGEIEDLGEAAVAEDIAREIEQLLIALDAEHGRAGQVVLTIWADDAARAAALAAALRGGSAPDVRLRDAASLGHLAGGIARRAQQAGDRPLLDLTPVSWREQTSTVRFRRQTAMLAGGLLGGWILLLAVGLGGMAFQRAQLERLREAERRWREPANAVRRLRMQVSLINRYMDRRTSALECLREISLLQPQGVDLSSFTYRKGDGLELVGEADSGGLVIQFNERLNASPLFREVRAGTRTLTRAQRHRFSFEVSLAEEVETP